MEREERARTLAITILQPRPIHSFSTTGSHLFTLSFWLSLSLSLSLSLLHTLTNERTHLRFHLFALFRSYIIYNFLSLHTHTLTRTHTHTRTPTHLHTLKTPLRTLALAVAHCYTLTLLYSQLTQSHTHTHTPNDTHTHTLEHSCTHAFMHSHTHPFFQRSVNSPQSVWSTSPVFCVQNFIHFDYKISPFEDLLQDLEGNQNIIPVAGPINKFLGIFKC